MKINELMVGDWYYWESEGKMYPYQVTAEDFVKGEIPNFQPVPLTSELLEKNGFKKDIELNGCYWRPDCRKYCIVKEIDTWYFAFRCLDGHICIFECNYIHELQQLLKHCKIEKEIILT